MTNLSPRTLQEETNEERYEREKRTGIFGKGLIVECHPTGEPDVFDKKHRVVCLMKPYEACQGCRHSKFRLIFDPDPKANQKTIMCPRWSHDTERIEGKLPGMYVETELKTCKDKPFVFCSSCPSLETLSQMYVDKQKDGWYTRYRRFTRDEEEEDE